MEELKWIHRFTRSDIFFQNIFLNNDRNSFKIHSVKKRSVSKYNKILSNANRPFDIEFIADDKPKSEWFV